LPFHPPPTAKMPDRSGSISWTRGCVEVAESRSVGRRSDDRYGGCTLTSSALDRPFAAILDSMTAQQTLTSGRSLQETFAPAGHCFGCGPANASGLQVASRPSAEDPAVLVASFLPRPEHEAFDHVVNGGILGTLLDCHANWTAAWHLMGTRGADRPPTTVTLEYSIRMRRPTPSDGPIDLRAWVVESSDDRATVEAEIRSGGTITATGRGTFVAVRPDHPAYDRW
jgi:acyl-coenzyme A thioesterase PaaI-like protein